MNVKDKFLWKFSEGTHFYCCVNVRGYSEAVLGVAAPIEDEQFAAYIHNKFDTYQVFPDLVAAQNYVSAIVALEADHG